MSDLLEVLHQFLSEGLTWSSAIAIILAILKIREGQHKRRVNVEIRNDIREIRKGLGLWDATNTSSGGTAKPAKKSFASYRSRLTGAMRARAARKSTISGREKEMNTNINVVSLTVAILSAVKLILESFKIDIIDDNGINSIANGVAALFTIVGVAMSHRKKSTTVVAVTNAAPYDVENMV